MRTETKPIVATARRVALDQAARMGVQQLENRVEEKLADLQQSRDGGLYVVLDGGIVCDLVRARSKFSSARRTYVPVEVRRGPR